MPHGLYGTCKPLDQIVSEYYLRLPVDDRPGVIAQIAGILGELNIGISSIFQPEAEDEGEAMSAHPHDSHAPPTARCTQALESIGALACVKKPAPDDPRGALRHDRAALCTTAA